VSWPVWQVQTFTSEFIDAARPATATGNPALDPPTLHPTTRAATTGGRYGRDSVCCRIGHRRLHTDQHEYNDQQNKHVRPCRERLDQRSTPLPSTDVGAGRSAVVTGSSGYRTEDQARDLCLQRLDIPAERHLAPASDHGERQVTFSLGDT
jgi:hypothetical protein